jgi:hypothetical protein
MTRNIECLSTEDLALIEKLIDVASTEISQKPSNANANANANAKSKLPGALQRSPADHS